MTKVLSFINLKGGVAKTTTAVMLADTLAIMRQKRVLVLDLDPQTNATLALIGEERWIRADDAGQTLAHLFMDQLNDTRVFDPARAVIRGASNLNLINHDIMDQLPDGLQYGRVDLLPSSIRLIDVQDRLQDISNRSIFSLSPMEVVRRFVSPLFAAYDYVLIDCPPNLGFVTLNGLEVSDHYLIPTIPDRLSTYGVPQIVNRIAEVKSKRNLKISCLGVIVTKYQSNSRTHKEGLERLPADLETAFARRGEPTPPILNTRLPQSNNTAEAVIYDRVVPTYRDKYGTGQVGGQAAYKYGTDLADEIEELLQFNDLQDSLEQLT
ncbi:ParA family protein [Deinococcus aquatilis]|jgi:chromosome partitioning protein|uniref:ParA family protein n=1 Tax=Deinococcus aquatilis TaxID=519440 RepID=UPI000379E86C|nr:AAA family ATPase [Deinococcus aquatilis]